MTKPGGIVVFTCASRFRMEHGTTASDGGSGAPSSVATGNEYYKNLIARHFKPATDEGVFLKYKFYRNFAEQDIYFVGIKKTASDVRKLETRFNQMDKDVSRLVKQINQPSRVVKINLQLLRMAVIRSGINFLYRNFSKKQLNSIKSAIKRGVVQN